jgi:hypothetical protein
VNHREEPGDDVNNCTKANTRCEDNNALEIKSSNFHNGGNCGLNLQFFFAVRMYYLALIEI